MNDNIPLITINIGKLKLERVVLWLYFGSNNLVIEKYQIKFREYKYKIAQMCTEKYLDYSVRTRVWVAWKIAEKPINKGFAGCRKDQMEFKKYFFLLFIFQIHLQISWNRLFS